MNNHMYIRLDDTGVTVSHSKREFCKKPVHIVDPITVRVGSRISIDSFYNLKTVALLILLGCAPLLVLLNMAPNAEEASSKRFADARAKCVEGIGQVIMASPVGTKTINCGE